MAEWHQASGMRKNEDTSDQYTATDGSERTTTRVSIFDGLLRHNMSSQITHAGVSANSPKTGTRYRSAPASCARSILVLNTRGRRPQTGGHRGGSGSTNEAARRQRPPYRRPVQRHRRVGKEYQAIPVLTSTLRQTNRLRRSRMRYGTVHLINSDRNGPLI